MGEDHEVDLFRRESIFLHLVKDSLHMTGMTRINEDRHLSVDQVRVTIVLIGILPEVNVKILFQFHYLSSDPLHPPFT
jgi:hypothetical protein